eukprot:gene16827-biopygen11335
MRYRRCHQTKKHEGMEGPKGGPRSSYGRRADVVGLEHCGPAFVLWAACGRGRIGTLRPGVRPVGGVRTWYRDWNTAARRSSYRRRADVVGLEHCGPAFVLWAACGRGRIGTLPKTPNPNNTQSQSKAQTKAKYNLLIFPKSGAL